MIQRYDWGEDGMLDFPDGNYMLVSDHESDVAYRESELALIGIIQRARVAELEKKLAIAEEKVVELNNILTNLTA